MTSRWRIISLITIMAFVVVGVTGITFVVLYRAAVDQQRSRLVELARSQASLIEAIARFDADQLDSDDPADILDYVLSQLRDSHANFEGLGGSGEFTLAKRENDQIVFLLKHRHFDTTTPQPVSLTSHLAEPMRRALSGESGTMIGLDYRGEVVLAAHEPIPSLGLGVVAKIDLAEIREPFIQSGMLAIGSALLLIVVGIGVFWRVGFPLVRQIEASEERYRMLFDQAADAIILTDMNFAITDWNRAAETMYGWSKREALGQSVGVLTEIEYAESERDTIIAEFLTKGFWEGEVTQYHRDGTPLHVFSHAVILRDRAHQPYGAVAINRDITARKRAEEALHEARNQLAALVSERTTQLQTMTLELQQKMTERQQLEESLQQYQQNLVTLRNMFDITFSKQPLDDAFHAIAAEIKNVTNFPVVAIELYDREREIMVFKSLQLPPDMQVETVTEVPAHETLSGVVVRTLQRLVETNALNRPEYAHTALRQLAIETFISVPMITDGEAIGALSLGHPDVVIMNEYFVDWIATLANYIASLITRKQTFESELEALENLAQLPGTPTTSRALGVKSLREQSTLYFSRYADEFEGLMELALEQRLYKVDHELSEKLQVLAQQLGFLKAGPRDVIELYSIALRTISRRVAASKTQIYAEEGRLLVLELMGYLVSYYRRFVSGVTLGGEASQGDRE